MANHKLNLWSVNLDYLVCRSKVTSNSLTAIPLSDLMIIEIIQSQLRLHGIESVKRRRNVRGMQLKSTDVDLHVFRTSGSWCVDFVCHVDALYLRPGRLWERIMRIHGLIGGIPGLQLAPLHAQELHLAVTFSGGGIGRRSIRRIQSRKKLWPKLNPYKRGEAVLYGKSAELTDTNALHKRYILKLCEDLGYRETEHGELMRLEFRIKAKRLVELGYPDLPLMFQNLMHEYPLMRGGSRRGKAIDPSWRRLGMAVHMGPWAQPPDAWEPTPDLEGEKNKALGLLEYATGILLADSVGPISSADEALGEIASRYYLVGSGNEQDLLDRIGIAREEHVSVGPYAQGTLSFPEEESRARTA